MARPPSSSSLKSGFRFCPKKQEICFFLFFPISLFLFLWIQLLSKKTRNLVLGFWSHLAVAWHQYSPSSPLPTPEISNLPSSCAESSWSTFLFVRFWQTNTMMQCATASEILNVFSCDGSMPYVFSFSRF